MEEKGNLFWEYLFRITLLIFWHTDLLSKSMPFIVQFSGYVYIVCLNWAQAQRVGSGNDLTPTAVSKSENTLNPVLQPNGLLAAVAISCPTAAWTTWKLLYCSSLQENRGVGFHTVVSVDEYSHSSDHLRALSSTKALCLWPLAEITDAPLLGFNLVRPQVTLVDLSFSILDKRRRAAFPDEHKFHLRGTSIMLRLLVFLCGFLCTHLLEGADAPGEVSLFSNLFFQVWSEKYRELGTSKGLKVS